MNMRNLILGPLFLLTIAGNVYAASFDCGQASTRVEKLICEDTELSELDSWMSGIYEQALTRTNEPSQLKEQQQRWLRDTRNRCSAPCCRKSAYTRRIQQLSAQSVWMTNEKEQRICTAVVDAINDGSIVRRIRQFGPASEHEERAWADSRPANFESLGGTLKIQAHGKHFTLGYVLSGGSCGVCGIEDINAHVKEIYPFDDDEERFWTGRGGCNYFLFIEGEPIIVTGRLDEGDSRASFVSWLAPDGAKRALCHLCRSGNTKRKITANNAPELCDAVLKDQIEKIPWSTSFSIPREDAGNGATLWDSSRDAMLDINLDGKQETIVLFDYASGAGCGYYTQWLRKFMPQQRSVSYERSQPSTETPLNKIFADSGHGPIKNTVEGDDWFTVQLFRYAGKPYILSNGSKSNAEVFSVWGNKKKCWCEYQLLPQHKVEVYYPVETWPTPTLEMSKFEQIKGAQALHNGVEANNKEEVLRLIKNGTPVDVADDSGETPLRLAVLYRHMDLAKLLLQHGAAVDGVSSGKAPLLLAMRYARDNSEMVKLLLDWKADPNVRENGRTALSIARAMSKEFNPDMNPVAYEKMKHLIDLLIRAGAKE